MIDNMINVVKILGLGILIIILSTMLLFMLIRFLKMFSINKKNNDEKLKFSIEVLKTNKQAFEELKNKGYLIGLNLNTIDRAIKDLESVINGI